MLHREIREKGGAYGGGSYIDPNGLLTFFSYRDPHNIQTFQAFEKAIQWGANGEMSIQDIKEAKLGVFTKVDAVVSPLDKGLSYFVRGKISRLLMKGKWDFCFFNILYANNTFPYQNRFDWWYESYL